MDHAESGVKPAKRPESQRLYDDPRWRRESKEYLRVHRWCVCPKHQGKTSARGARATVVDHKTPHCGNLALFWDEKNWQALAKACHDSWKRGVENREIEQPRSRWFPVDVKPSAIPLHVVCGPPGSGKTTWVHTQAKPDDVIIDLDEIRARLTHRPISHGSRRGLTPALIERNRLLRSLAREKRPGVEAWLIVGAPTAGERAAWAKALRPMELVVFTTPAETCVSRIRRRNPSKADELSKVVAKWFLSYEPRAGDRVIGPSPKGDSVQGSNRIFQGGGEYRRAEEYLDPVRVSRGDFLA